METRISSRRVSSTNVGTSNNRKSNTAKISDIKMDMSIAWMKMVNGSGPTTMKVMVLKTILLSQASIQMDSLRHRLVLKLDYMRVHHYQRNLLGKSYLLKFQMYH